MRFSQRVALDTFFAGSIGNRGAAHSRFCLAHPTGNRLAPAARMALTNYLMQSVICASIFYGYGLGLFGQVGAAAGLLLTLVIYALEVTWSQWWLAHFRFGPVEWLWRTLTYLRVQPRRLTGRIRHHERRKRSG